MITVTAVVIAWKHKRIIRRGRTFGNDGGRARVGGQEAVSDVGVTDGAVTARVVSFFELRGDMIWRMTELWPDPLAAPAWRASLAEQPNA